MRLNRGTIVLLVASLVVIIAVLLLTINQAAAPGEQELTQTSVAGPVFPGVTDANLVRFEVRNNTSGQRVVMAKSAGSDEWSIADASDGSAAELDVDQSLASRRVDEFLDLQASESFEADNLADFGLNEPAYSLYAVTDDGAVFLMYVGNKNPSGTRYYTVSAQIAPGETSPDLEPLQPFLQRSEIDTSREGDTSPAGQTDVDAAQVAADPTLDAMAEQIQEMEDGPEKDALVATYSALVEQRDFAATAEATAETDAEAEATEMAVDLDRAEIETSLDESTDEPVDEATAEASPPPPLTEEAPSDSDVTVEPVDVPRVTLEGTRTIRLVTSSTLDNLIDLINDPPVIVPTATPTPFPTPNPISEVDQTATAAVQATSTAEASFTQTAAAEATGEATAEATATPEAES